MSETVALPHAFTPENARMMALRSWERRRERTKDEPPIDVEASPASQPADYTSETLSRVRLQLDRLADMMEKERVPKALDQLAAAFFKLARVEQELAGRPLPGSRRPGREKPVLAAPVKPLD